MAINYTTLLGLAQPVTGTEANIWGDAVNDQITALLDSAIAGAATISVTAGNVTLTDVDGSADQARMAILILTGTPGTTRNVVAPSRSKTYIVINQSDSSAVVKGSATTGVTVRAGQAATCVWNGADFEIVASGDVDGPASATDNAVPRYDGTTGKLIQNSGVTIDDSNNVSGVVQLNATTVDTTNIEVTNLKAKDGTTAGSIADSTGIVTLASTVLTTTDINGGTIDNTSIGASTPSTVVATQVDITAQGDLRLQDTTGGQYVALQAPGTLATNYTLTLPVDDGTSGQALITDGSGVLSWSTAASGDVYGPASATDNAVARYDGTTGKIIQNSAVTIADDGATVIDANSTSAALRITQVGTGNALLVEDAANPDSTPVVVTANGELILGNTSSVPVGGFGNQLQVWGAFGHTSQGRFTNDTGGARQNFVKSRSTSPGGFGIVQANDRLGDIFFLGADGAAYIPSVAIFAEIDGTPGTNDMPGRLMFSTTADGASSPTERMRIDNAGRVGIGGTPSAGQQVLIGGSVTGSTTAQAVRAVSLVQSDVTSDARGFISVLGTQAATFTLTNLRQFYAAQGSFGAGSTVTNQMGFLTDANLTGATNNYGFFSNIASGTGRFNFYAGGSADNFFAGNVGIGTIDSNAKIAISVDRAVRPNTLSLKTVNGASFENDLIFTFTGSVQRIGNFQNFPLEFITNNTERMRIGSTGTISLGAAPGSESLRVTPVASAVNFVQITGNTTGNAVGLKADGSDFNVSLGITTKGNGVSDFYSNNFGSLQFRIAHTASAVNYLQVTGGATGSAPSIIAQGSDTNIDIALTPKGTGNVRFGTLTATSDVAITGFIEVKDSAGNVRKLAVIS